MKQNFVITQPYTVGYSLVWLLDAIVRDRLARKASIKSNGSICNLVAACSKVLRLGEALPFSHPHQFFTSISVSSFNLAYVRSKNSSFLIGFLTNVSGNIIIKSIGLATNIAQTAKHLSNQVLTAITNYQPVGSGYFNENHDKYHNTGWRSLPPSSCIVPFQRRGGAVMTEQTYLSQIQAGREGFVYLIHAEGTTRYKIGRSVNPISRHQTLQGQSPYPLKIVRSFWTLDAIADEATLHMWCADFRVFGEWFELDGMAVGTSFPQLTKLKYVEEAFSINPTMHNLADDVIESFSGWLRTKCNERRMEIGSEILHLYCHLLTDRKEVILTEKFLRDTLPGLAISRRLGSYSGFIDSRDSDALQGFMQGAIETFVVMVLNKKPAFIGFSLKK